MINTADSQPVLSRRYLLKAGLALAGLSLGGCTVSQVRRSINTGALLYKGNVSNAITSQIPGTGIHEIDSLVEKQVTNLLDELVKTWGEKRIASSKEYVKYTDHYKSRALINFTTGKIQVETVVARDSKAALKKATVSTLLTPTDPTEIDLFSAKEIKQGGVPFLFDLVQDHQKKPIRYAWRANQYADYLIKKGYQTNKVPAGKNKGITRYFVQFEMVKDYQGQQKHRYHADVLRQSKRFKIEPALIYGIIETESAFNPFAVSSAPAYGLMQIVPSTAGRDVYRLLNKQDGAPTKELLFKASQNIQYGTAYLSILFTKYLSGIRNKQSREYCVIAAYNTGSGNVFEAFHSSRSTAIEKINKLSSQKVFQYLVSNLAYSEARRYLVKVTRNKRKYLQT
ncbi:MAG: membrane-bound lytic murein transglycosylase C [Thiomicrorhabdus sp.]|nr:MAG: membrane-bound lytic murein transglycosylase C [Thiomicrorhabdus sp.]